MAPALSAKRRARESDGSSHMNPVRWLHVLAVVVALTVVAVWKGIP